MPEEIIETAVEDMQIDVNTDMDSDEEETGQAEEMLPDSEDEVADLPPGMTDEGLRDYLRARYARSISADMRIREHFVRLARQAEAAKERYPDFDLAREMENPVFARLTAPGVGIDPETAYEVVHGRNLRRQQRSEDIRRITRAVASGSLRPDENALTGSQAAPGIATDPRNLSPQARRDIRRRVEKGERVTF